MNLVGYTSTSKRFETALNFAISNMKDDLVPVVYEINFKGQIGLFEISNEFTAYPGEGEVLI